MVSNWLTTAGLSPVPARTMQCRMQNTATQLRSHAGERGTRAVFPCVEKVLCSNVCRTLTE